MRAFDQLASPLCLAEIFFRQTVFSRSTNSEIQSVMAFPFHSRGMPFQLDLLGKRQEPISILLLGSSPGDTGKFERLLHAYL